MDARERERLGLSRAHGLELASEGKQAVSMIAGNPASAPPPTHARGLRLELRGLVQRQLDALVADLAAVGGGGGGR
jgi:hypothetical protein